MNDDDKRVFQTVGIEPLSDKAVSTDYLRRITSLVYTDYITPKALVDSITPYQLHSKMLASKAISSLMMQRTSVDRPIKNVYFHACWYGQLPYLVLKTLGGQLSVTVDKANWWYVDQDERCESAAKQSFPELLSDKINGKWLVNDLMETEIWIDALIVNTSLEHLDPGKFSRWCRDSAPKGTAFYLQGSDLVADDHVNPFKTNREFSAFIEDACKIKIDHYQTIEVEGMLRFSVVGSV